MNDRRCPRAPAQRDVLAVDRAIFATGPEPLFHRHSRAAVPRQFSAPGPLVKHARQYGLKALIDPRGRQRNSGARAPDCKSGTHVIDDAAKGCVAPDLDCIERLRDINLDVEELALIHRRSGADRAGFAAGLFVLPGGAGAIDARRWLSPQFGHIRQARPRWHRPGGSAMRSAHAHPVHLGQSDRRCSHHHRTAGLPDQNAP
ncbi:MAG: hypothetical protein ACREFY_08685 [Acetobacteraceae bacterium]